MTGSPSTRKCGVAHWLFTAIVPSTANTVPPMTYQYGQAFERLGISGMGHLGATWCAQNASGVLVLMAHQNYVHRDGGVPAKWVYEMPDEGPEPDRGSSAKRSLAMIESY